MATTKFAEVLKNDPEGRITDTAEYGEHIGLTCVNHPTLRWHTKNIAPIGARKIYYNLAGVSTAPVECNCSAIDLRPLVSL